MPFTTKYIFVTGGVVSSLGKGLASACHRRAAREPRAEGHPAEARSLHQRRSRHDEPLPARRGLRHRRRRRDRPRPRPLRALHARAPDASDNNFTTGQIYDSVISKERRGRLPRRDRAGDPPHHRRDQGRASRRVRRRTSTCVIVEIGGTVGDIESLPFLEAIRQFTLRPGHGERALHPPHPGALHHDRRRAEDQADPAQRQGAARDRHPARHPALPHRPVPVPRSSRHKIALFCNVASDAVITAKDVELHLRGAADVPRARGSTTRSSSCSTSGRAPPDLDEWEEMVDAHHAARSTRSPIAIVGKYVDLTDSYKSLNEALHPRRASPTTAKVNLMFVDSEEMEPRRRRGAARAAPTASWFRAASASAGSRARSRRSATPARTGSPSSASAWGCRCAVIEFARNVAGSQAPTARSSTSSRPTR